MRAFFWKIHRWAGLLLSPFFAIILISGLLLLAKPLMTPSFSQEPLNPDNAYAVVRLVDQITTTNTTIRGIDIGSDHKTIWITQEGNAPLLQYSISSGLQMGKGGFSASSYQSLKSWHQGLAINAKSFVLFLTCVMIAMMLVGLIFMTRPQWRKSLISWHNGLGVWFWPIWLILPVTAVMMSFHSIPHTSKAINTQITSSVPEIVRYLHEQHRLQDMVSIKTTRQGPVITLKKNGRTETLQMLNDTSLVTINTPTSYLPKIIHEGTWGGRTGIVITFLMQLGLLFFLFSGCLNWIKGLFVKKPQKSVVPQVESQAVYKQPKFLVAYATQNGTARRLAEQTFNYMKECGIEANLASMSGVRIGDLNQHEHALMIVSTTGNGELPDSAQALERMLHNFKTHVRVSLLALGDKQFEQFCGGGNKMELALRASGAHFDIPTRRVNGSPEEDWENWIADLTYYFNWKHPEKQAEESVLLSETQSSNTAQDTNIAHDNGVTSITLTAEHLNALPLAVATSAVAKTEEMVAEEDTLYSPTEYDPPVPETEETIMEDIPLSTMEETVTEEDTLYSPTEYDPPISETEEIAMEDIPLSTMEETATEEDATLYSPTEYDPPVSETEEIAMEDIPLSTMEETVTEEDTLYSPTEYDPPVSETEETMMEEDSLLPAENTPVPETEKIMTSHAESPAQVSETIFTEEDFIQPAMIRPTMSYDEAQIANWQPETKNLSTESTDDTDINTQQETETMIQNNQESNMSETQLQEVDNQENNSQTNHQENNLQENQDTADYQHVVYEELHTLNTHNNCFLITYASQTGNAEKLAQITYDYLEKQGLDVHLKPISELRLSHMNDANQTLMIIATTGEGELPVSAIPIERDLRVVRMASNVSLLALGDANFANFCGGAKKMETALQSSGANFILPTRFVNGSNLMQDWHAWMNDLSKIFNFAAPISTMAIQDDREVDATLIKRTFLTVPQDNIRPTAELIFRLPENITFKGGDLLSITPPNSKMPRKYSIGSDSMNNNEVRLTVGLHQFMNENGEWQGGRCSHYLLNELSEGDTIKVTVQQHPTFSVLENDNRPIIMVAAGTGIAPLVGFLPALRRHPRLSWLFYGNADREDAFLYQNQWEEAVKEGVLSRISTVFDNENKGFIQDELLRQGEEIYHWINENNALVYVCGRLGTVGNGTETALASIFREFGHMNVDDARHRVQEMKNNNQLKMDLFG